MDDVKDLSHRQPIEEYHCWVAWQHHCTLLDLRTKNLDSVYAKQNSDYSRQRVPKCNYMPASENPSEQGSRGAEPGNIGSLWFKGPNWLSGTDKWPSQPEVCETLETRVDYKAKMGEAATRQRRREELQCGPTPTQVIRSTGSSAE